MLRLEFLGSLTLGPGQSPNAACPPVLFDHPAHSRFAGPSCLGDLAQRQAAADQPEDGLFVAPPAQRAVGPPIQLAGLGYLFDDGTTVWLYTERDGRLTR